MADIEYSLGKKNSTGEVHIYRSKLVRDAKGNMTCEIIENDSICKQVDKTGVTWVDGVGCLEEQKARERGAKLGRDLCGVCVSDLYLTPKKK